MPAEAKPPIFNYYNILRADGTRTKPDEKLLFEEDPVLRAVLDTITEFFPYPENVRIADLGCLEGAYTIALARQGYKEVVGIDARQTNIDKCLYAAEGLNLKNLKFVTDDARHLAKYGKFDVTLCSGLLYHLDKPKSFLQLLGKVTTKMLILNTHYALKHDPLYDSGIDELQPNKVGFGLSHLETNEGLKGRWYTEVSEDASDQDLLNLPAAAFGNKRSFWLIKEDLLQAIHDSGFKIIYEQYDFLDGKYSNNNAINENDRSIFVAIKV